MYIKQTPQLPSTRAHPQNPPPSKKFRHRGAGLSAPSALLHPAFPMVFAVVPTAAGGGGGGGCGGGGEASYSLQRYTAGSEATAWSETTPRSEATPGSKATAGSESTAGSGLCEWQRPQIAAHQPSGPAGRDAIPLGLARELSDLFVAKVAHARKLNGAPALPRPAPCSNWDEEDGFSWDGDDEWPPFTGGARPVNRLQLSAGKPPDRADAPVMAKLLLDLPDDLLVQILASRTSRVHFFPRRWHQEARARQMTEGHALAVAGACCQTFATCAQAAAKVVANRHGWRLLPGAGGTPMQHMSRLEHDTTLVRSLLINVNKLARPLERVTLWGEEVSLGFIGALSIDAQVRQQHTLELGRLLILLAMRVGPDDPQRDQKVAVFSEQLAVLMTQPGTPLDASWLAGCVFPLVEMHMAIENRGNPRLHRFHRRTPMALVLLLCFLEPSVLRSHPETFEWVRWTMKLSGPSREQTAWSIGLKAWNERCEAQGLGAGCDTETRDAKLEAILHSGVRGSFACLSALDTPVDLVWLSRIGREIFPAVYH